MRRTVAGIVGFLALSGWIPGTATAQQNEPLEELEGIGIDEKLDVALPLDLAFLDEEGQSVTLGTYFQPGKPMIVNLVYFSCPMLCNVFQDGLVDVLERMNWVPGDEFDIVTVSIDPRDTPEEAKRKQAHYVTSLGRPEAARGWRFLTGPQENISRLADALGFRYRYNEKRGEYVHSAGLFVCTPDGRTSRVLYGVVFDPQTLRLSLLEAADGKIGSPLDQILLFCFAYDHTEGRYAPVARNIMKGAGAVTLLVLGSFLAALWWKDARKRRAVSLGARP